MSTPQWFAQFEREEAMRQDRLDDIRARQRKQDEANLFAHPTIIDGLARFDDLPATKRELLVALLEFAQSFGARQGVRAVRAVMAEVGLTS